MSFDLIITIFKLLFRAYSENSGGIRRVFVLIPIFVTILMCGLVAQVAGWITKDISQIIAGVCGACLAATIATIAGYQSSKDDEKKEEAINEKQAKVLAEPEKVKLVWDLAQDKLERYLDRNLRQIRSIFMLCTVVMLLGFGLVVAGAIMVYRNPNALQPSVLSAVSGILISFLGGSFMLIYRSTMAQAKDYVAMLERINAVGMSLQVIDSISDKSEIKRDEMKAQIAKDLLSLYKHT